MALGIFLSWGALHRTYTVVRMTVYNNMWEIKYFWVWCNYSEFDLRWGTVSHNIDGNRLSSLRLRVTAMVPLIDDYRFPNHGHESVPTVYCTLYVVCGLLTMLMLRDSQCRYFWRGIHRRQKKGAGRVCKQVRGLSVALGIPILPHVSMKAVTNHLRTRLRFAFIHPILLERMQCCFVWQGTTFRCKFGFLPPFNKIFLE